MKLVQFGPLTVATSDDVLEPRPWTLLQSTWAAELAAVAAPGPLAEVCSGAGHIGQAAARLSGRALVQVDVDPTACATARDNAARNGLADRVEVRCAPMESAFAAGERFPVLLLDPPYLPTDEVDRWPHDPVLAVDGGPDGLALHRRCLAVAAAHLPVDGSALLQARGRRQVDELTADIDAAGLVVVEVREHDADRAVALLTFGRGAE